MAEQDLLFSHRVMRPSRGCLLRVVPTLLSYKGTNKIVGVADDKRRAVVRADPWALALVDKGAEDPPAGWGP